MAIKERVLITGGAGFIGSRLAAALVSRGADVVIFDNLHPQVHGDSPNLSFAAPLWREDIRDPAAVHRIVRDFSPEVVFHLAAETGTGQSADEPARYCEVNVLGTAHLVEALRRSARPPRRIVLAATRAVYGEGAYRDADGIVVVPAPRKSEDMALGKFGFEEAGGHRLEPIPTKESTPVAPGSIYGSTKLMQEYLITQSIGEWDTVILRLQNVYGPGQSLLNPYTGVLSIFCQQLLAGKGISIYEDGQIVRDFVYVDDVVDAFVAAGESSRASSQLINIGSGAPVKIIDVARMILRNLSVEESVMTVTGQFRPGDIRHALADVARARDCLNWQPIVDVQEGIARLTRWARDVHDSRA